jgi:hypothetical protein
VLDHPGLAFTDAYPSAHHVHVFGACIFELGPGPGPVFNAGPSPGPVFDVGPGSGPVAHGAVHQAQRRRFGVRLLSRHWVEELREVRLLCEGCSRKKEGWEGLVMVTCIQSLLLGVLQQ